MSRRDWNDGGQKPERHAPLNLPIDRSKIIDRACAAPDGSMSVGGLVSDDQDLGERVSRVIEQRDSFRALATEVIATLMLERNQPNVSAELRELCDRVWKPAFDAALNRTELTDEQIDYALAAHAIDTAKALERIKAMLDKRSPR